jgi:putative acetyltransferase
VNSPADHPHRGIRTTITIHRKNMLTIARESPDQAEILALFDQSDAYAASLYPAEDRHPVDVDYLAAAHVRFFVARWLGRAVGCGALVIGAEGVAEVKRVVVDTAARGKGVGRAILEAIEAAALAEGVRLIQLETGPLSTAALHLYRSFGYRERGPFGAYRPSPNSTFMERDLRVAAIAATDD